MKCDVSSNHLITNVLLKSVWVVVWNLVSDLSYVKKHSSDFKCFILECERWIIIILEKAYKLSL